MMSFVLYNLIEEIGPYPEGLSTNAYRHGITEKTKKISKGISFSIANCITYLDWK